MFATFRKPHMTMKRSTFEERSSTHYARLTPKLALVGRPRYIVPRIVQVVFFVRRRKQMRGHKIGGSNGFDSYFYEVFPDLIVIYQPAQITL